MIRAFFSIDISQSTGTLRFGYHLFHIIILFCRNTPIVTGPTMPRPILRRALEFDMDLPRRVDTLLQIPHLVARLGRCEIRQLDTGSLPRARRVRRSDGGRRRPPRRSGRRRRLGRGVVVTVPAAPFRAGARRGRGADRPGAPPRGGRGRRRRRAGAVVDGRVANVVAVPRPGHLDDQVRHGHFNVQLDRVGEGVELHVPKRSNSQRRKPLLQLY